MDALGLRFVGPQAPRGRQADPWPSELPEGSKNVPMFHSTQQTPATATRQLDFVFASESIADRVQVRALNEIAEWGPSDHCRIVIDVASMHRPSNLTPGADPLAKLQGGIRNRSVR
jgi:hypothetical protein